MPYFKTITATCLALLLVASMGHAALAQAAHPAPPPPPPPAVQHWVAQMNSLQW